PALRWLAYGCRAQRYAGAWKQRRFARRRQALSLPSDPWDSHGLPLSCKFDCAEELGTCVSAMSRADQRIAIALPINVSHTPLTGKRLSQPVLNVVKRTHKNTRTLADHYR